MNEPEFEVGSGNIFADLGFAEPEEELARADLAHRIATAIEDQGLTPDAAATLMGMHKADVSALVRGHLERYSSEWLTRCLNALTNKGDIVAYPPSKTADLPVRAGR